MRQYLIFLIFLILKISTGFSQEMPEAFVYVKEEIPTAILEMRYTGSNNFVGKPIEGYNAPKAILTKEATAALKKVQEDLNKKGYCIKIYDAYRPQRAVEHFIEWAKKEDDTLQKQEFYPNIDKGNLFQLDYIAPQSGHSRGSTVDLTIVDSHNRELDMGSNYDFFGSISHQDSEAITEEQQKNRNLLREVMVKHGFVPYPKEWWHYTFQPEPFPDTYFDFPVE